MQCCDLAHLNHQRTIATSVVFVGIGLHSGERVRMRLKPAGANEGISLKRKDLATHQQLFVPRWDAVTDSTLCTTIGNQGDFNVSTIEHLLSALSALGIDNLQIELDGPEIPIMDGSALPFVEAFDNVGIRDLDAQRELIVVRRPVRMQHGDSWAELSPDPGQRVTVSIDFNAHDIGVQSFSLDVNPGTYRREIAPARTFGFAEDLMQLRRRGLALGGSIKNAILLRDGRVANLDGLRFRDEFVRHKVLDVVGDLALVGLPIIGQYRGNRPSHRLNAQLTALLMKDPGAWVRVRSDDLDQVFAEIVAEEPGTGSKTPGQRRHRRLSNDVRKTRFGGPLRRLLERR
jgi:UDP-3-O-[3-hydroxymyristoyl] N-acetylglucosamine deacetylase